jgi:hypothetical protein
MQSEFERCWPWLEASLQTAGYVHDGQVYPPHTKASIWRRIATNQAKFWPFGSCVILTEIITHASGLRSQNNGMAKLTAAGRKRIKSGNFALPGRRYHAQNVRAANCATT